VTVLRYHFSGVAGAGMGPLACLMRSRGHAVQGSDRAFDLGKKQEIAAPLRRCGIEIVPQDGRAITQILTKQNRALSGQQVTQLGEVYKQLNSSVGQFGAFTLHASTAAIESSTPGDARYRAVDATLAGLDKLRDSLALRVKGELEAAAFGDQRINGAAGQTIVCKGLISAAGALAKRL